MKPRWQGLKTKLHSLLDPLFWIPFIFIAIIKLGVFQFAAILYMNSGFHYSFGMDFAIVEAYSDFTSYYMQFVSRFVQGYLPYTPELYAPEGVQVYIYTPLFLYFTTLFYFIPSEVIFPELQLVASSFGQDLYFARVGFSFVFFDIATCVILFVTVKQLTRNVALPPVILLLFGLNPVALWWGDYMWLSTPIHTFFLVLGFFFMLKGELRWAALAVTIATMVKQTAGLLLPVILFLELGRGKKRFLTSAFLMAGVAIICSMPYLLLYPQTYLLNILRGAGSYWRGQSLPDIRYPVPVAILAYYFPEPIRTFIIEVLFYGIPFGAFLATFWVVSWIIPQTSRNEYHKHLMTLVLLLSLAMHTFWPRGIYKYYLIAMLPFLLLHPTILRGPKILYLKQHQVPKALSQWPFDRAPGWIKRGVSVLLPRFLAILNHPAPWWIGVIWGVSVAIFAAHRLVTPLILFLLFVGLMCHTLYAFVLKKSRKPRQASEN